MGGAIERRPGAIWLLTVLLLSPLAFHAVANYDQINYGLVQDLSRNTPSRRGMDLLARHDPAGDTGPLTVLIRNDKVDLASKEGRALIGTLTDRLIQQRGALKIADLRSVTKPLGITPAARKVLPSDPVQAAFLEPVVLGRAINHYISTTRELGHHVTRLDVVLTIDPFDRATIDHLDTLEQAIRTAMPEKLRTGADLYLTGPTASFRDLKRIAEGDRTRINLLVTASVLTVLVLLLRRLFLPIYLVLSILFGYLVTLGAAYVVFGYLDGPSFPGLDWTVPIFLFTLLIAVGEDYNIILAARVHEEQHRHGPIAGVTEALARTGSIISGCGFIMAGTFSSLAFGGSMARMYQLGFALTFGVLLDTFIVRPVLVPAYLILVARLGLRRGRGQGQGHVSKLLGAPDEPVATRG